MIQIQQEVRIEKPPEEVFRFLADVRNLPRWQSGAVRSELLTEPPVRHGSIFSETVKVGPMTVRANCTVTNFTPVQTFAFEAVSKPLDYAGSFHLSDEAGATRLSLQAVAHLKGFWRLLEPVLSSDLRREARTELETLANLMDLAPVA